MRGVASSAGFSAFEKIKCIFSIASMGNLEKSWECFSPEVGCRGTGRWLLASGGLSGLSSVHRMHRSESGAQRPVCGRFGDPLCA